MAQIVLTIFVKFYVPFKPIKEIIWYQDKTNNQQGHVGHFSRMSYQDDSDSGGGGFYGKNT